MTAAHENAPGSGCHQAEGNDSTPTSKKEYVMTSIPPVASGFNYQALIARIGAAMEHNGITPSQLAGAVNVEERYVQNILALRETLHVEPMVKMCQALGIDLYEAIDGGGWSRQALDPVRCFPWCIEGDGNADALFPDDQWCWTAVRHVDLAFHEPFQDVDDTFHPAVATISGHAWPDSDRAVRVVVEVGDQEALTLTPAEAIKVAAALKEVGEQLEVAGECSMTDAEADAIIAQIEERNR